MQTLKNPLRAPAEIPPMGYVTALNRLLTRAADWLFRCKHNRVTLPYNDRQHCLDCGASRLYFFRSDFSHGNAGIETGPWKKDAAAPQNAHRVAASKLMDNAIAGRRNLSGSAAVLIPGSDSPLFQRRPRTSLETVSEAAHRIMDRHLGVIAILFFCIGGLRAQSPCPHTTQFKDDNHRILVPVKVDGYGPYLFLLDTGAQATIVDPSLIDAMHADASGTIEVAGIGLHASAKVLIFDRMELDGQAVSRMSAVVFPLPRGESQNGNQKIIGILGEDFLERFDVVIDHHSNCIHLFQGRVSMPSIEVQP